MKPTLNGMWHQPQRGHTTCLFTESPGLEGRCCDVRHMSTFTFGDGAEVCCWLSNFPPYWSRFRLVQDYLVVFNQLAAIHPDEARCSREWWSRRTLALSLCYLCDMRPPSWKKSSCWVWSTAQNWRYWNGLEVFLLNHLSVMFPDHTTEDSN